MKAFYKDRCNRRTKVKITLNIFLECLKLKHIKRPKPPCPTAIHVATAQKTRLYHINNRRTSKKNMHQDKCPDGRKERRGGAPLLEEGEVHAAIGTVLHEAGMLGEVVVLAVLEHEETALGEEVAVEHDVGQLGQLLECIGRVGKDEVEVLTAASQVAEHVSTHGEGLLGLQFVDETADEAEVKRVLLHRHHMATATTQQFERDAACARKEVECRGSLIKVEIAVQHIEEIFLGKVRGGTSLEGAWDVEPASLVFSCDYSHVPMYRI